MDSDLLDGHHAVDFALAAEAFACPMGASRFGMWCIDDVARGPDLYADALADCDAEGKAICSIKALSVCDFLNAPGAADCTVLTDDGTAIFTSDFLAVSGEELQANIAVYVGAGGSNQVVSGDFDVDLNMYFCCSVVMP